MAGRAIHAGELGPFVHIRCQMADDLLTFLQGDAWLSQSAAALNEQELQSFEEPKQRANKSKISMPPMQKDGVQAKKLQVSGALTEEIGSSALNGLKLPMCGVQRMIAFRAAFMKKHAELFKVLKKI